MYKIAIVEDSPNNLDLLDFLLRDRYRVIRCESGEDALLKFCDEAPDLVIMDISLREMNGVEVLKRIRNDESLRDLPVIALTAHAMVGDRERYLEAGFDGYLTKPILDMEAFFKTIQRSLPEPPE